MWGGGCNIRTELEERITHGEALFYYCRMLQNSPFDLTYPCDGTAIETTTIAPKPVRRGLLASKGENQPLPIFLSLICSSARTIFSDSAITIPPYELSMLSARREAAATRPHRFAAR